MFWKTIISWWETGNQPGNDETHWLIQIAAMMQEKAS